MKNTQEVLGPLGKLTAQALIERYDFLDRQRLIRKTTFSSGVTAIVNASPSDYMANSALGGRVVLPPYGFLIEAGSFAAFHATSWGGLTYTSPTLFTLTSQDGQPLDVSASVRVFHAFGDPHLTWRGQTIEVERDALSS
jgi:hypothetical protein